MIKLKSLITSIAISLGVGATSAIITKDSMDIYKNINKPELSPPPIIFPIVWTILFLFMGISAYLIYISKSENNKQSALITYALQLIINFIWPILFFNNQLYLFAFIWLIILWFVVLRMITLFYKISKIAGALQIPYICWLTFAGYLNIMVYLLNR